MCDDLISVVRLQGYFAAAVIIHHLISVASRDSDMLKGEKEKAKLVIKGR